MHLSHERHQFLRWWDVITHTETCIHMSVALKLLCIIELAHAMRNWCQFLKCRQPNTQTRDTLLQLNYNVNDFSNASIDKYWNRICSVCVCVCGRNDTIVDVLIVDWICQHIKGQNVCAEFCECLILMPCLWASNNVWNAALKHFSSRTKYGSAESMTGQISRSFLVYVSLHWICFC